MTSSLKHMVFMKGGVAYELSREILQNMYPSMYDKIDMDEVAGLVIGAIRQREIANDPLSSYKSR